MSSRVSPIVVMSRSFSRANTVGSAGSSGWTRSGRSSSQRIEVVAHGSLPIDARSSRKLNRARLSRDRTVPTGTRARPRSPRSSAPPTRTAAARRVRPRAARRPRRRPAATAPCASSVGGDRVGRVVGRRLAREEAGGRVDAARLAAPVPRQQVRRDAVEPRSGVRAVRSRTSRASRTRRGTPRRAARRLRRHRRDARGSGTARWRAGRTARRTAPGALSDSRITAASVSLHHLMFPARGLAVRAASVRASRPARGARTLVGQPKPSRKWRSSTSNQWPGPTYVPCSASRTS